MGGGGIADMSMSCNARQTEKHTTKKHRETYFRRSDVVLYGLDRMDDTYRPRVEAGYLTLNTNDGRPSPSMDVVRHNELAHDGSSVAPRFPRFPILL